MLGSKSEPDTMSTLDATGGCLMHDASESVSKMKVKFFYFLLKPTGIVGVATTVHAYG